MRESDCHFLRNQGSRRKGVFAMYDQEDGKKTSVEIMDALDLATKLRASIGCLVKMTTDNELSCLLSLIEDSAEILEGVLTVLHQGERQQEERAAREAMMVAEDVPFD